MNRRSFLKFCGIAPVVPMVAVEAIANNSAPIIFDPKSICGLTGFVAGGYSGTMMIGEAMESGKAGDSIWVKFAHHEVKI